LKFARPTQALILTFRAASDISFSDLSARLFTPYLTATNQTAVKAWASRQLTPVVLKLKTESQPLYTD
jgi:hypothetical protein